MELSQSRERWQKAIPCIVLLSLVFRVVMQALPQLATAYSYVLSLAYAAIATLVFFDGRMLKQRGFMLLLLCFLWAILSSCLHAYDEMRLSELIAYFLMMAFSLFVCYPLAFLLPKADATRALDKIATAYTIAVTVLCVIALASAIMGIQIPSFGPAGNAPAGMADGRLSVFAYPMTSAVLCALALLLLCYEVLQSESRVARIWRGVVGCILFIALSLTKAWIACAFCCLALGGIGYILSKERVHSPRKWAQNLLAMAVAVAVMLAGFACMRLLARASDACLPQTGKVLQLRSSKVATAQEPAITPAIEQPSKSETTQAALPEASADMDERTYEAPVESMVTSMQLPTLQGRAYAWEGAIRALMDTPIRLWMGTSPVLVMEEVRPFIIQNAETNGLQSLRSIYVQTLAAYGIPGCFLFAMLLGYILLHAIRVFFLGGGYCTSAERTLPMLLLFCLCVDLLETYLSFGDVLKVSNPLFFLAAGYVVRNSTERIPKKTGSQK